MMYGPSLNIPAFWIQGSLNALTNLRRTELETSWGQSMVTDLRQDIDPNLNEYDNMISALSTLLGRTTVSAGGNSRPKNIPVDRAITGSTSHNTKYKIASNINTESDNSLVNTFTNKNDRLNDILNKVGDPYLKVTKSISLKSLKVSSLIIFYRYIFIIISL